MAVMRCPACQRTKTEEEDRDETVPYEVNQWLAMEVVFCERVPIGITCRDGNATSMAPTAKRTRSAAACHAQRSQMRPHAKGCAIYFCRMRLC